MAKDKCILAYSGGLDTSVCIKWLQDEKGLDVIAVVGEVGQEHEGLEAVRQRALETGAIDCIVADMREDFAADYLSKALFANANFEGKYPLVSALSRPLISKYLVDAAHKFGAKYIAHGCTGKGNDPAAPARATTRFASRLPSRRSIRRSRSSPRSASGICILARRRWTGPRLTA